MDPRKGGYLSSFWIGDFKDVCFGKGGVGWGGTGHWPLPHYGERVSLKMRSGNRKTQEREARRPGCIVPALPNE